MANEKTARAQNVLLSAAAWPLFTLRMASVDMVMMPTAQACLGERWSSHQNEVVSWSYESWRVQKHVASPAQVWSTNAAGVLTAALEYSTMAPIKY